MHLAPPIARERVRPLRRVQASLRAGREEMLPFDAVDPADLLKLPEQTGRPIGDSCWPAVAAAPALAHEMTAASLQDLLEHTSAAPPAPSASRTLPPAVPRPIRGATVAAVPPLPFVRTPVYSPRLAALPLRPRFRFGPPPPPANAPVPTVENPAFGPPPQEFFRRPEPGPPSGAVFRRLTGTGSPFFSKPEPPAAAIPVDMLSEPAAPAAPNPLDPEMPMATTPKSDPPIRPFDPNPNLKKDADPLPSFGEEPQVSFLQRVPVGAKVGTLLGLILLGAGGYFFALQSPSATAAASTTGITLPADKAIGWTNEFAGDAQGASKGRHLLLLRQSLKAVNYDFDFSGQIAEKSIGWVIHAADPRNYYAMRIDVLQPGPNPKVSFYKYAVVDGQEGPRMQLPLPVTVRDSTVFHVHVAAHSGTITTTIQDQIVDVWNDERVRAGAAGFVAERGERVVIKSVDYAEKR